MTKEKTYILLREVPEAADTPQYSVFGRYSSPKAAEEAIQERCETGRYLLGLVIWDRNTVSKQVILFDEPPKPPQKKRGPNKPKTAPPVSPPLFQSANGEEATDTPELERKESVLHNSG